MYSAWSQPIDAKLANEYYQKGEFDKALSLYEKVEDDKSAIPVIHSNYLQLILDRGDIKKTEKYLKKTIKLFPNNLQYRVDQIFFYQQSLQEDERNKLIKDLRDEFSKNQYQLALVARQLATRQFYTEAIEFYEIARKMNNNPYVFSLDLAAIYRAKDDKPNMMNEYINFALASPTNVNYVKNLLQNILTEESDQNYLENLLIDKIQKYPNEELYSDLLIWLELQRKNFYLAFIQARAMDKRNKRPGDESMKIARIAYDNNSWDDAIDIYQYVVDNYPQTSNYAYARQLLIKSKESKVKNTFPIDTVVIQNLVKEYAQLYNDIGANITSLEALRNEARLYAFYLNELDTAIAILNTIIAHPRSSKTLIAESKLDLGDIHILTNEPWESTLLYSQVEKAHKDSPLAYEAKLRNAKLNYYTGNFALAKSHLDILKLATTRTISNDAIALSLLINDNTAFDSTDQVMQDFASAELMIFTNHKSEAKSKLKKLLEEYQGHDITDEIYWLQARLALEEGKPNEAIENLQKILDINEYDILSDDASFQIAVITEENLDNVEEAKQMYQEFLRKYPGSRHSAEARMRFRKLRGDMNN